MLITLKKNGLIEIPPDIINHLKLKDGDLMKYSIKDNSKIVCEKYNGEELSDNEYVVVIEKVLSRMKPYSDFKR